MKKSLNKAAIAALALAAAQALGAPSPAGAQLDAGTIRVTFEGRIKMEATKEDGSRRTLVDWFNNRILDQGLNRIGTNSWVTACQVGTGNTAPADTDAGLAVYVAGTSTLQASSSGANGAAPYYGFILRTFRFPQGAAAGNLAEVGLGWATSGSTLFSRALIKDAGGTPTTVTVAADEFLDVSYELRCYAPAEVVVGPVTISGVDYTFTVRASNTTSFSSWAPEVTTAVTNRINSQVVYNGAVGAVTAMPSGTQSVVTTCTPQAYVNNSLQRDFQVFLDLNTGNLAGGITALFFGSTIGAFQAGISPAIAKTSTKLLTLNYRVSWARHV